VDTNQVPRHESEHLSADTLAELAEDPRAAVDKRHLAHLARCRSCMAAYADAVRYRTAWLGSPELFEETEDGPTTARASSIPWMKTLPFAAGLVAAVGIGGWLLSARAPRAPEANGTITTLLERASATDLVLPGGERGAVEAVEPYRSGPGEDRIAREVVDALRLRYEQGSGSIAELYQLAAALAAMGRVDAAHDYVREGRRLAPGHAGFLLLEAVLSRGDGHLERAEQLLRQARAIAPGDLTIMLDHAIVLEEQGEHDAAAALLRQVIERAPATPLARRAEAVLGAIGSR
jgi:tetratricopeptide (TPR) repeat protein